MAELHTPRPAARMDGAGLHGAGAPLRTRLLSGGTQNEISEVARADFRAALRIPGYLRLTRGELRVPVAAATNGSAVGGGTAVGARIPVHIALELTLTGASITAARGYRLGLFNAVVAPELVFATALEYAERIAVGAPLGLAACKELVRLAVTDPARAAQRQAHWQRIVFTSADAAEGTRALLEKRPPVRRGR